MIPPSVEVTAAIFWVVEKVRGDVIRNEKADEEKALEKYRLNC